MNSPLNRTMAEMDPPLQISVVIPALNEAAFIAATIEAIQTTNAPHEIIVVDGGSTDATSEIAQKKGARVLHAPQRGRGSQLAFAAAHALGNVLWFLHADTRPTSDVRKLIHAALSSSEVIGGNFRLVFDGDSSAARFLTRLYPHLRLLGLSYGDAGMFLRRDAYEQAGGFKPHPLFEDLDLLRRLRRRGKFVQLNSPMITSSRRFEGRNFGVVFAGWTGLQLLFWLGASPRFLARLYSPIRAGKTNTAAHLPTQPAKNQFGKTKPERETPAGV